MKQSTGITNFTTCPQELHNQAKPSRKSSLTSSYKSVIPWTEFLLAFHFLKQSKTTTHKKKKCMGGNAQLAFIQTVRERLFQLSLNLILYRNGDIQPELSKSHTLDFRLIFSFITLSLSRSTLLCIAISVIQRYVSDYFLIGLINNLHSHHLHF